MSSAVRANVVPPKPVDDDPLPTDGDDDIHTILRKLRLDEGKYHMFPTSQRPISLQGVCQPPVAGLSTSGTNKRNVKYNVRTRAFFSGSIHVPSFTTHNRPPATTFLSSFWKLAAISVTSSRRG